MKSLSILAAALLAFPCLLSAQTNSSAAPGYRDPGTATIYAVVLPGGGQLYSGETGRGLLLLGGSSAAILAGTALSSEASCKYDASSPYGLSCKEANRTPLTVGMLASLAVWGYGIFDAKKSAERQNLKRGRKAMNVAPIVESVDSRTVMGLQVAF